MCVARRASPSLGSLYVPKGVATSTHPPEPGPALPSSCLSLTPFLGLSRSFRSDICLLCTPYLSVR